MKKLNLQLGSIKEMLTKEQMKRIAGGEYVGWYKCCEIAHPSNCSICVWIDHPKCEDSKFQVVTC
jgi:hypothetical protein